MMNNTQVFRHDPILLFSTNNMNLGSLRMKYTEKYSEILK